MFERIDKIPCMAVIRDSGDYMTSMWSLCGLYVVIFRERKGLYLPI